MSGQATETKPVGEGRCGYYVDGRFTFSCGCIFSQRAEDDWFPCPLHESAEEIASERDALREQVRELREALSGVMEQIDSGTLVRDVTGDSESGWAMKQLPMARDLQKAAAVLARYEAVPNG